MAGSVLATYPSSSSSTIHEVRLGNDGVTYCTCMGWRMNKHCKHLDAYQAGNTSRSATASPKPKRVKAGSMVKETPQETKVRDVTNDVIRQLRGER